MNKKLDERLREQLASEIDTVSMTEEADRRVLAGIHRQVYERSNIMRYPKRKIIVAIAAAIVVTGTITAIAAGKIVGLVSSTNRDEAIHSVAELTEKAEKELGGSLYIAEVLSNGNTFKEGYIKNVRGLDEAGNTVASYPEITVMYGENGGINLSVKKINNAIPETPGNNQIEMEYQGILLGATEDSYLFLPPDVTPSEADLKLEQEGKLYISYGSSKEEREVFRNVSWTKDGFEYLLFTFGDVSLDDMMDMAKAYIDGGQ